MRSHRPTSHCFSLPSARGFGRNLEREIGPDVKSSGKRLGTGFGKMFAATGGLLAAAGVGSILKNSIGEAREAQKVGALTESIIKSTGGAAKVTAKQVGDLAGAISAKAGIDDEAIQSGANLLLTFKNVRNEAGKGAKIFDRATQAATDLSAAGFGEMSDQSKMLGKALNDPIKGITALSRSGVTFSDQQKDLIKNLVESGKTLEAQKIILGEVESQVGGAAKATATAGDKMEVAWGNLQEQLGTALLPVVDKVSNQITKKVIPAASQFIGEMQDGTGKGGEFADKLLAAGKSAEEWGKKALEAGKTVLGIIGPVVSTLDKMPGPLKEIVLQAGLMGLAMKKLGLLSLISTLNGGTAALGRFGAAIRGAAGVGGMLLLASGTRETSKSLGVLKSTAGGALLGFAVAGPWGAAIGAGAGALLGLATQAGDTAEAAGVLITPWEAYASTMDRVSGSVTRATKDMLLQKLQQSGLLDQAASLDISTNTLLNGMLGREKAHARLTTAIRTEKGEIANWALANQDANGKLSEDNKAIYDQRLASITALEQEAEAVKTGSEAEAERIAILNKLPTQLVTDIKTVGGKDAVRQVADLAAKYRLNPKKIETLIKLSGVDASKDQVVSLKKEIIKSGDAKPSNAWENAFNQGVGKVKGSAKKGSQDVNTILGRVGKDAPKPKVANGPFGKGLSADITFLTGQTKTGGEGIGSNLALGTSLGIARGIPWVEVAARTMAIRAKIAAESELEVRSPSRVFKRIGANTVLGFAVGVTGTASRAEKAISDMIGRIDKVVKKHDLPKKMAKQAKAVVNEIGKAASAYRDALATRNDAAKSISSGLLGEFNLSELLGKNEFGLSLGAGSAVTAAQALVARMKGFAKKLGALITAGMPTALVNEIAGYGSLEGTRVADAFLKAGKPSIQGISSAYSELQGYANSAGATVANGMYGGSVDSAAERLEAAVERGMSKMGIRVDLNVDGKNAVKIIQKGEKEKAKRK